MSNINDDYKKTVIDGEECYMMNARGVFRFIIFEFIKYPFDGKKVIKAAKHCFKLISENGCGLTEMQLYSKIRLMDIKEAEQWINSVYDKYINQDEVMNIFKSI